MMPHLRSIRFAIVAFLVISMAPLVASAQSDVFTADQEQRVGELVRAYLLENPEVLIEALEVLQVREEETAAARAQATLLDRADDLFNSPLDPIGGNPDGPITIVEFYDYNCPFCRRVKPTIHELLAANADIRYVYKEFPILADSSIYAARAALAVWRTQPERYDAFHNALMVGTGQLSEDLVLERAVSVGVDLDQMRQEMDDPEIQRIIQENQQLARDLGISGTPSFVIGDQIIGGAQPLAVFEEAVRRVREN